MRTRRMDGAEREGVVQLWHTTKRAAYPYLELEQRYTLEQNRRFFRERIAPRCDVWVAEQERALVGFLAICGSYIDRLYVHPERQRKGIGTALIERAKELSPRGLELHTHQKNVQACAFYEAHGFRAVHYGLSPPPESEPDVEYHWRPGER